MKGYRTEAKNNVIPNKYVLILVINCFFDLVNSTTY